MDPNSATSARSIRRRLLRSHACISLPAIAALIFAAAGIHSHRSESRQILEDHAVIVQLAESSQTLLERTSAALRAWILLGDESDRRDHEESFSKLRATVDAMNRLDQGESTHDLTAIESLLNAVHDAHWWVADVASMPGNNPPVDLVDRIVSPLRDGVVSIADDIMLDESQGSHIQRQSVADSCSRLKLAVSKGFSDLNLFVNRGRESDRKAYLSSVAIAQSIIKDLHQATDALAPAQRELANALELDFKGYEAVALQAIASKQENKSNVATGWLEESVLPLESQLRKSLNEFGHRQTASLAGELQRMSRGTESAWLGCLVILLLVASLYVADRVARSITACIPKPESRSDPPSKNAVGTVVRELEETAV